MSFGNTCYLLGCIVGGFACLQSVLLSWGAPPHFLLGGRGFLVIFIHLHVLLHVVSVHPIGMSWNTALDWLFVYTP